MRDPSYQLNHSPPGYFKGSNSQPDYYSQNPSREPAIQPTTSVIRSSHSLKHPKIYDAIHPCLLRSQSVEGHIKRHHHTKSQPQLYSHGSLKAHLDSKRFPCYEQATSPSESPFCCGGTVIGAGCPVWKGCGRRFSRFDGLIEHFLSLAGQQCLLPLWDSEVVGCIPFNKQEKTAFPLLPPVLYALYPDLEMMDFESVHHDGASSGILSRNTSINSASIFSSHSSISRSTTPIQSETCRCSLYNQHCNGCDLHESRVHPKNQSAAGNQLRKKKSFLSTVDSGIDVTSPILTSVFLHDNQTDESNFLSLFQVDIAPDALQKGMADCDEYFSRIGATSIPISEKNDSFNVKSFRKRLEAHLGQNKSNTYQHEKLSTLESPLGQFESSRDCDDGINERLDFKQSMQLSLHTFEHSYTMNVSVDHRRPSLPISEGEQDFMTSDGRNSPLGLYPNDIRELIMDVTRTLATDVVRRYLETQRNGQSRVCPSSQNESRQGSPQGSFVETAETSASTSLTPPSKRSRADEDDDLDNSGDDKGKQPKNKRPAPAKSEEKLFACPYYKSNPERFSSQNMTEKEYRGCGSCLLRDIPRLKQHLYRVHRRPDHYCGSCFQLFKSQDDRDAHGRQRPACEPKFPQLFTEKMTVDQMVQIRRRDVGAHPSDNWYNIFKILFPGKPLPYSPYANSGNPDILNNFVVFFRSTGPELFLNIMRNRRDRGQSLSPFAESIQEIAHDAFEIAYYEYLCSIPPLPIPLESFQTAESSADVSDGLDLLPEQYMLDPYSWLSAPFMSMPPEVNFEEDSEFDTTKVIPIFENFDPYPHGHQQN